MNDAAQPLTDDSTELSPWWLRTVAIVLVVGFAGLLAITMLAYRNAPPIPGQVVDAQGNTIFTGDDISKASTLLFSLLPNFEMFDFSHIFLFWNIDNYFKEGSMRNSNIEKQQVREK